MEKRLQLKKIQLLIGVVLFLMIGARVHAAEVEDYNWRDPVLQDISSGISGIGLGEPPFLGTAIDPNLMIILDNSGSMYDLAYVENNGECFDDAYDPNVEYAGYFTSNVVYSYNLTTNQYVAETLTNNPLDICTPAVNIFNKTGVLCVGGEDADGDLTTKELKNVTHFGALGNFLNWLATSKFDIEKKILTGGKWDINTDLDDATTDDASLVMESRGCSNRRFVKEIVVQESNDAVTSYYLDFGVRPPMEEDIPRWSLGITYVVGDKVLYNGKFYETIVDNFDTLPTDPVFWKEYFLNRWYPGVAYEAGAVVYDAVSGNMYRTKKGGTSTADALELAYDTGIDDWELYNLTHIEIYPVTTVGFGYDYCQLALQELQGASGDSTDAVDDGTYVEDSEYKNSRLGRIKYYTEKCMGFESGGGQSLEAWSKAAFNHSMQECWYYNKFGIFQPGGGSVSSIKKDCEGLYDHINPWDLTPWDNAYVCAGQYGLYPPYRYVGRCWELPDQTCVPIPCDSKHVTGDEWFDNAEKVIMRCVDLTFEDPNNLPNLITQSSQQQCNNWTLSGSGNEKVYTCNTDFSTIYECQGSGSTEPKWTDDNFVMYDESVYSERERNECVTDFCAPYSASVDNTCSYDAAAAGDSLTYPDCGDNRYGSDLTLTRANTVDVPDTWLDANNWYLADPVGDYCVDQALRDFCKYLEIPEVIDPSDSTGLTGTVWNAPAILVDSGITGQIGKPISTMLGYIRHLDEPKGVIQGVVDKLRIGLMSFNENGAATECESYSTYMTDPINYNCPPGNQDGAQVITYIDSDPELDETHERELVNGINSIKAVSWTPLAEALYNAIGYYAQKTSMRLNADDFVLESEISSTPWSNGATYAVGDIVTFDTVDLNLDPVSFRYKALTAGVSSSVNLTLGPMADTVVKWTRIPNKMDPVQYWCQSNNILIITEGASTADVNEAVRTFASNNTMDTDTDNTAPVAPDLLNTSQACPDGLYGSTLMDDFTAYGHTAPASSIYQNPKVFADDPDEKQNISTYIVSTGSLRDSGELNECNPKLLMERSADQGRFTEPGTDALLQANNAETLSRMLTFVFSDIMNRASAGSAASVISSSRGGEGAVYQAIFWPEQDRNLGPNQTKLKWAGDVHSLFLGPGGMLYEDTDQNGLFYSQDANGDGILNPAEGDTNGNGVFDHGEDVNGNGVFDQGEDLDGDGILDPSEDLNGNGFLDPGEDLDGDGILDPSEDVNGDGLLDRGEDVNGDCVWSTYEEDLNGNGILDPLTEDANGNGILDPITEDTNGDGLLDPWEDLNGNGVIDPLTEDVNGDGILDPWEDLNGNGIIDPITEDANDNGIIDPITEDTNGDGILDPVEDLNGNGIIDTMTEDANGNGVLDHSEDLNGDGIQDLGEDLNDNCILDLGEDVNGNGVLDPPEEDLNGNGFLDPSEDVNGNGVLDVSEDADGDGIFECGEDLNCNGIQDSTEDKDGSGLIGDKRVIIYFDSALNESRGCYQGFIPATDDNPAFCPEEYSVKISNIKYIWSANNWLQSLSDTDTSENRGTTTVTIDGTDYKEWVFTADKRRYIFTWNDLDNDGIVDKTALPFSDSLDEVLPFTTTTDWGQAVGSDADPDGDGTWGPRGPIVYDFDLDTVDEVNSLISWIRGQDEKVMVDLDGNGIGDDLDGDGQVDYTYTKRDRRYYDENIGSTITWRLGDIIHSTPILVASPAEHYDLLYKDRSYLKFAGEYNNRRHVIYVGGNDGMMHAFNAGFYSADYSGFLKCAPSDRGFIDEFGTFTPGSSGSYCDDSKIYPDLGEELWAYIPYNLLPHLNSLSKTDYDHKYYVDGVPRIFDVQIFKDDAKHPGGWGTILVGSMRFGGAPVEMKDVMSIHTGIAKDNTDDARRMSSSFFILDITDPEGPPELLGEMTFKADFWTQFNLGYSTTKPTLVPMHKNLDFPIGYTGPYGGSSNWYLVMGSGPTELTGENNHLHAKLGILPLEWLQGKIETIDVPTENGDSTLNAYTAGSRKAFRISRNEPGTNGIQGGTYDLYNDITFSSQYAFVSDLITLDFDLGVDNSYKADAVYFGTVEGRDFEKNVDDPNTAFDESLTDTWDTISGGRIIRLVTRKLDVDDKRTQLVTVPSEWEIKEFMNVGRPITGAPAVGSDGTNFWVYFGTGRFFDPMDKTDGKDQYFFGVKEPKRGWDQNQKDLSWETVTSWDASTRTSITPNPTATPGAQGLVRSDQILVDYVTNQPETLLYCEDFTSSCLPLDSDGNRINNYSKLLNYIAGEQYQTADDDKIGVDGWYRLLNMDRERTVSQPSLLGGLVTFTSYQPFLDACQAEGVGYLYGVHYQTGTAWKESVFGFDSKYGHRFVKAVAPTGVGLTGPPSLYTGDPPTGDAKAFIQTSTGEILEISQENLPYQNYKSGRSSWMYLDTQGN